MTPICRLLITILLYCTVSFESDAQYSNIPMQQIDLFFAGDAMQHKNQLTQAKGSDGKYSYSSYYKYLAPAVKRADISIVNLETPIGERNYGGYPSFCAPDSFLHAITDAGFNLVMLANNHILDRGKSTVLHTLDLLDTLKTAYCGIYRNMEERDSLYPLMIEKKGVKIVFLNYTYGTNGRSVPAPLAVNIIDKEIMSKDIEKAKTMNADAIIACMHWGDEYVSLPPKKVKELADWLLEQGVDHIIGHHPHVVQPIEIRKDPETPDKHAVAYSLGNLVSNMQIRKTDGGITLHMRLRKILNYTRIASLQYMLTWIKPKEHNGRRDFTILPAATTIIENNPHAESRLRQFLEDTRTLFRKHNKGNITETFIDSVKITR